MQTIVWIGLGKIGLPMAGRLAGAGWTVRGYDIDPVRLALAEAKGVHPAPSMEEALDGGRMVFTSLPTEEALLQVCNRLARELDADRVVVETSTVGPQASGEAARTLAARGVAFLRAPVSGSTALAEAGTLTTFVSGPRAAFERARDALKAYTRAQIWLGEAEEARYAKLAVNIMVAVTAGMMGEALALARRGGIDWAAILEVIGESAVASPLVKYKLDPLRRRDFAPAATGSLVQKDLDLALTAAARAGVAMPLAERTAALYAELAAAGLAEEDFFSIVKLAERAAGLSEP